MSTLVPLLNRDQIDQLPQRAREVVEYRKSGLSLNHVQGCPLDCAYCIRHTYGLWDQRQPRALMTDAEAVEQLVREQGRVNFARPRPRVRLLSSGPNYRTRHASGMSNFNAEAVAHGQHPVQQLLEVTTIEAQSEIGARLGLTDEDNLVVVRRRLFLVDDEPVQLCDGYYPRALVQGTLIEEDHKIRDGAHAVLEDPTGPIKRTVTRFIEDLEVRMPTPYEVELLHISPGVPIARILRTALDAHHEPVEVLDSVVRAIGMSFAT